MLKKLTPLAMTIGMMSGINGVSAAPLQQAQMIDYRADLASQLQLFLQSPAEKSKLIQQLQKNNSPILFSQLSGAKTSQDTQSTLDRALQAGIYPEVWLHNPGMSTAQLKASNKLLIAYAPQGDDKNWQSIPAINLATGEKITLNTDQAPDIPVIVVETHGHYSMQNFIGELNIKLSQLDSSPKPSSQGAVTEGVVATTKLNKISLQDDEEPWIKGGAEIFTFVSGVFDNNKPSVKAIGLPYLDHDKTDYYPNQILVNWNDYNYNAVNFSMYEEDSQTNYKDLAKVIVTAIGAIGSLAGFEPAIAIAQITNRIQDAMPDSWYTDDHDYVDTCYTIVKGQTLNDQWCARRNAKISVGPFNLQSN